MLPTRVDQPSMETWRSVLRAEHLTAERAAAALDSMELARARALRAQEPAAKKVLAAAVELGRADLTRRARLILANIDARNGAPIEAALVARQVRDEAEAAGDQFGLSRALYVLAWAEYSIGNYPSAQISAVRSVELLPVDVPLGLRADHTMMIGISYMTDAAAQRYFDEALEFARLDHDPVRVMIVHNNTAYAAAGRGDLPTALAHITAMREIAARESLTMFAVQFETIARVYIMAGRYAEAVNVLADVLDRSAATTSSDDMTYLDPNTLPIAMLTMAEAHRHLGQHAEAGSYLDRAGALATTHGIRMVSAQIREQRAHLLAARGDYRAAFEEFTAFYDAIREWEAEEERARARVVQAAFESDRNRRNAEHYRELAMRDALTGLYNRRHMEDVLKSQIHIARESGTPLSLAIIDVDLFKRINGELSHDVGDGVLRELAELFLANKAPADTVCRLGGEEFVVIMPGSGPDRAFQLCEKIRSVVADHPWQPLTGSLPIAVSIGVTTVLGGHTSASAILSDADRNLYAAKRSGRNRVMSDARE